jgi:1,2-diacylglycerol 3-alpha-glucosyltransferase
VVLAGQQDSSTAEIRALAESLLGEGHYRIDSVPYSAMSEFYGSADVFVLASLKEGFGRVLLEASSYGLPCLVDENAVMRYVLGKSGFFADLRQQGVLAGLLSSVLSNRSTHAEKCERVADVRARFGWSNLKSDYLRMFEKTIRAAPSYAT